jgi:ubiquitin fusion degradation protein 1
MQVLQLEPGDILQVKSADLPSGRFIKLQAQSISFLDISDPKAVLENVFRNYSCLTVGDVFTFEYNDQTFDMAVQEVKPDTESHAIVVLETDLEVDFATPVGYEEPKPQARSSGMGTPAGGLGSLPNGGLLHTQGSMAQAINYASIAPDADSAAAGAKAVSSNFLLGGQKLSSRKSSKAPTPKPSTPVAGTSTNPQTAPVFKKRNGPQPLRLPPGKLFFGYALKPLKKTGEARQGGGGDGTDDQPKFQGQGQTLRSGKKKDG